MQIALKQLNAHLSGALSPLYLISGDECLLSQEARDCIIAAARKKGFADKQVCYFDTGFSVESLSELIRNHDLFSEKKIIDIRNAAAKFDKSMLTLLQEYSARKSDDQIIIITTEKLSLAQQKLAWCEFIKKNGCFLPIWPIALDALPQWIAERARQKFALQCSPDIAKQLAFFSEGNLLSAEQALQKLQLLYPGAQVTREQLISVLSDHARFSVFDLSESLLRKDSKKSLRILKRLEQTDEEPVLVLWAICQKIREMPCAKQALPLAANADEIIKGAKSGNVWQALSELCLIATGATP